MPNATGGVLRAMPQGTDVALTKEEAAAILEIAFLAIAADRKLGNEEIEAFRLVAARLKELSGAAPASQSPDISQRELEKILEGFSGDMDRNAAEERVRILGTALKRREIREVAYKVAYALALCDLDTSDEEFEFDLQLVDALELTSDQAAELESQVMDAFQDG